jgi:hypothetical protein
MFTKVVDNKNTYFTIPPLKPSLWHLKGRQTLKKTLEIDRNLYLKYLGKTTISKKKKNLK